MRRTLLLWVLAALLTSCESAFYDLVSEKPTDPTAAAPHVGAFQSLYGIPVTWDKDVYADEYVVSRRPLTSLTDVEIYRGSGLGFVDNAATVGTLYAYTLAKTRGGKTFSSGGQALGAFSDVHVVDPNGANDTKETATAFVTETLNEQLAYYHATDSKSGLAVDLYDRDWFYVDLGPRLALTVIFSYEDANNAHKLVVSANSDLIAADGAEPIIYNPDIVTRRVWFSVHYNTVFYQSTMAELVGYHMAFKSITNYIPTN